MAGDPHNLCSSFKRNKSCSVEMGNSSLLALHERVGNSISLKKVLQHKVTINSQNLGKSDIPPIQ